MLGMTNVRLASRYAKDIGVSQVAGRLTTGGEFDK